MKELVSAEKEPFGTHTGQQTVDRSHPLRHAVVIGVFRLARELDPRPPRGRPETAMQRAAICANHREPRIARGDQPQAGSVAGNARRRRAEHGTDKVIVEKRRSHADLCLFESQQSVVVPWRLPEHGKGQRISLNQSRVGLAGVADFRAQLAGEQLELRFHRPERPDVPKDFAAVIPGHPHRCDFAGYLVEVQVGRAAHVGASIRQIHRPLGVVVETRDEVFSDGDDLMALSACARDLSRHADVCAVAKHSAERIAGQ